MRSFIYIYVDFCMYTGVHVHIHTEYIHIQIRTSGVISQ